MRDDIFGESLYRTVLSAIPKTFDHSEITIIIALEALIFLIGLVMMDESRTLNKTGLTATFISLFVSLLFSHSVR